VATDLSFIANAARELARLKRDPLAAAVVVAWAKGSDPHPKDFPLVGSDFYGSSKNFEYEVRAFHPGLVAPERECVPAMGPQPGWSPAREQPPAPGEPCGWCGGLIGHSPGGADDEPTRLVCPKCQASAFDPRLARQRQLAGDPPAQPRQKAAKRASRRERRAAARARKAGDETREAA